MYIDEIVMKKLKKKGSSTYRCFTYDRDLDYPGYMKFRVTVNQIRMRPIDTTIPTSNFTIMDGNCPLFYYWHSNVGNCETFKDLRYLPSDHSCERLSFKAASTILQTAFSQVIHFRKGVIDRIEEILNPFRHLLVLDQSKPRSYPFRKYQNLITVHARYGNGGADFKDSRTFLKMSQNQTFINCVHSLNQDESSLVYLATDSSIMKRIFEKEFGNRVITINEKILHSAFDLNKSNCSATLATVVDFVILTMGQEFIGTARSSFSSLAELVGGFPGMRVSPEEPMCRAMRTYLPG